MTNTQNDNDFLYCCQEGKLKTLKHLVNNGYEPSKNVLHQALYFTLVGDHKNCYHYILDIIDFYNYDIDLYFNNNMIFNQALLNEKIDIKNEKASLAQKQYEDLVSTQKNADKILALQKEFNKCGFQNIRISEFSEFQNFQNFRISKFSKFQNFRIFQISDFQNLRI